MDKFGIFNLLGSLINQNSNSQEKNQSASAVQKNDFLSSLSSLFSKENVKENAQSPQVKPLPSNPPLQSKMLSTMTSHDKILTRVKNSPPQTGR